MSDGHRPVRIRQKDLPPPQDYRTYGDWQATCRYVRSGEKSHRRDERGVPLFAREQTEIIEYRPDLYSYSDIYWRERAIEDKKPKKRRAVEMRGPLQRGTKPDHFEDYDVSERDPYQDKWLFT